MLELEEILKWLGSIWWFLAFMFSTIAVFVLLGYRVKIHEKVLFSPDGELRFVTKKESYIHRSDQMTKNTELEQKMSSVKHEECPLHHELALSQIEMRTQQRVNMVTLTGLTAAMAEGKEFRTEMSKKITAICLNTNTLLTKQQDMLEDIRELKDRRIETRI